MQAQAVQNTPRTPEMVLRSWALPASFPPQLLPPQVKQLIMDVVDGVTKDRLMRIAAKRGLQPQWRDFGHDNHYGLWLTENDITVPLIAIMTEPH